MGIGIGLIGLALGSTFGFLMDNLALGISIRLFIGVVLGISLIKKK